MIDGAVELILVFVMQQSEDVLNAYLQFWRKLVDVLAFFDVFHACSCLYGCTYLEESRY